MQIMLQNLLPRCIFQVLSSITKDNDRSTSSYLRCNFLKGHVFVRLETASFMNLIGILVDTFHLIMQIWHRIDILKGLMRHCRLVGSLYLIDRIYYIFLMIHYITNLNDQRLQF